MGKLFGEIDSKLADWIHSQSLFFVATAPAQGGHVNLSPKGPIDSLRIVDGQGVEYEDHIGSGAETAAHIRENGRVSATPSRSTACRRSRPRQRARWISS